MFKRVGFASIAAGALLTLVTPAAHADDPHQPQPLEVRARFHGTCTHWYVTLAGIQQPDLKPNDPVPTADVEVDIHYNPVYTSVFTPGSYDEVHRIFRHNGIPKLVQVYADGVLIRERLFGCGYFKASAGLN